MQHIRRSILLLTGMLAIFFNLERLDFGQDNVIDISSFVYVLTLAAVLTLLLVPRLGKVRALPSMGLWAVAYLVLRLLVGAGHPILGGLYTYLSLTELGGLCLSIWLAHQVAYDLYDFEEAVHNITLDETGNRVRKLDDAAEEIELEMQRSRRYQRPLTVTVLAPERDSMQAALHRSVKDVQAAMVNHYVLNRLARAVSNGLRRTDLVLEEFDRSRLIILSPETSNAETLWLAQRIKTIEEELGISLQVGAASFPEHAVTFEELIARAETNLPPPDTGTPLALEPTPTALLRK